MLVLSRKEDQKIRIGNDIIINVISISEGNVRLGIEADKNIKIFREEIYTSIKDHTVQAVDNVSELTSLKVGNMKLNKVQSK
jgi:carbon storage regulator